MVFGKGRGQGWILPLLAHASVHGAFTALIVGLWTGNILLAIGIGALETVAHFAIDRIKASPKLLGRYKDVSQPVFWWCLGLDQLAHGLCYVAIASIAT